MIKNCLDRNKYYNKTYYEYCENFNNRKYLTDGWIWTIV